MLEVCFRRHLIVRAHGFIDGLPNLGCHLRRSSTPGLPCKRPRLKHVSEELANSSSACHDSLLLQYLRYIARFEALAVVVYNQLLHVFTVRHRHCNASEPTAIVRKSYRCHADEHRYKCMNSVSNCSACIHVTKKTEARRYHLNARGEQNKTENGNKTERNANGHTILTTCTVIERELYLICTYLCS